DRDVPVAGADVVCAAVVVEGQLELLVLAGEAEEVVRRLELAVADDRELAAELHPQRLVEGTTPLDVGDPDHRVQVPGHGRDPSDRPATPAAPRYVRRSVITGVHHFSLCVS